MSSWIRKIEKGGHDIHGLRLGTKLVNGRPSDAEVARLAKKESNQKSAEKDW